MSHLVGAEWVVYVRPCFTNALQQEKVSSILIATNLLSGIKTRQNTETVVFARIVTNEAWEISMGVVTITDNQFETEVLQASEPVLVYFWAPWCGPCRLMAPIVDKVATAYSDRLKVIKMEVDPNPESVKLCKVEGVPALRLFQSGEVRDAIEGAITKQKVEDFLTPHLPT